MAKSQLVVTHQPMATTARFGMTVRAIQHLYYALLYTTPAYASKSDKWTQWVNMGFGVNIREHPRGAERADKLKYNSVSNGQRIEIPVLEANDNVLKSLQDLLGEIDAVRKTMSGKSEAERKEALSSSEPIKQKLLDPVARSLDADGLPKESRDAFLSALRDDLLVFTVDTVASIATEPAPPMKGSVLPARKKD